MQNKELEWVLIIKRKWITAGVWKEQKHKGEPEEKMRKEVKNKIIDQISSMSCLPGYF